MGKSFEELKLKAENLHELNPMMGHRGCRLAVSYPEIAEMQTRAILEAAIEVKKNKNYNVVPEIMVPLIIDIKEFKFVKNIIDETAKKIFEETGMNLEYHVGTMIEMPRAALTADKIAEEAEFFSFGTNDLTQLTDEELRKQFAEFSPKSDWERFFYGKTNDTAEEIKTTLDEIRKFRNKIAHCKLFTFSEYNACNDAILKMSRTIDQAIRITEEKDFYDKNIETLSKSFERMREELNEAMKEISKTVREISRNITESFRGFFMISKIRCPQPD